MPTSRACTSAPACTAGTNSHFWWATSPRLRSAGRRPTGSGLGRALAVDLVQQPLHLGLGVRVSARARRRDALLEQHPGRGGAFQGDEQLACLVVGGEVVGVALAQQAELLQRRSA